jgi:hypothetical protein
LIGEKIKEIKKTFNIKIMGQVLGMISTVLILSAIYFRVGGQKSFSKDLFIVGIIGELLFIAIMIMAIFD